MGFPSAPPTPSPARSWEPARPTASRRCAGELRAGSSGRGSSRFRRPPPSLPSATGYWLPSDCVDLVVLLVMLDLLALGEIDRVLADVGGEIGDTLQVSSDQ